MSAQDNLGNQFTPPKELGIDTGGLGAHNMYEQNQRRSEKIGAKQWCRHCHKPMEEGQGYIVNYHPQTDSLYPMSVPIKQDKYSGRTLLGSECVKKFLKKDEYSTYAEKA